MNDRNHNIRLLYILPLIVMLLGVLVGALWTFYNIDFIPKYGDTSEYLELSRTLRGDQYRGILYPTILNCSSALASSVGLPMHIIVYFLQSVVALFSVYCLATLMLGNSISSQIISAFISISVFFNPLVNHFCLTLLTDSLATSFTILFITFLTKGCFLNSPPAKRTLYFICATLSFVLMATIRVEKLYLAGFLFFGCCIALVIFKHRCHKMQTTTAHCLIAFLFFAIGMGTAVLINKETTVYNTSRPPLDFKSLAFNRVVWPHMNDVYKYLPKSLKQQITPEEARQFDSHNNYVYPFLVRTLSKRDGAQQITNITLLTLEHFPFRVIGKIIFDFVKYSAPNFAFPMEAANILPKSVATSWTISRMEMFTPVLSRAYLLIGSVQFVVLFAFFLIKIPRPPDKDAKTSLLTSFSCRLGHWAPFTFLILGATVLLNAGMFTLFAGMDAHIIYALPTYTIIQTVVVTCAIVRSLTIFKDNSLRVRILR